VELYSLSLSLIIVNVSEVKLTSAVRFLRQSQKIKMNKAATSKVNYSKTVVCVSIILQEKRAEVLKENKIIHEKRWSLFSRDTIFHFR